MKNKNIIINILLVIVIAGCSFSNIHTLREVQNNEIAMLKKIKRQILLRPAKTPEEMLIKKIELKIIEDQIILAIKVQENTKILN